MIHQKRVGNPIYKHTNGGNTHFFPLIKTFPHPHTTLSAAKWRLRFAGCGGVYEYRHSSCVMPGRAPRASKNTVSIHGPLLSGHL